ncbi:MAG: hypothetical protein IKU62_03540 [Ruminiclostridium sp.]|nr:hypothetical protein [Ruminiclostridium sp.]
MRNHGWTDFPFSRGELEQAARIAGQAITDGLPEPEDCTYDFSQEFCRKMDTLTGKTHRSGWSAGLRKVACFFLVFLVGGAAWFTVEAQMSEEAFGWDRETDPAVLYQAYEDMVAEANETYDVDLTLAPLEEMDPERMPTVTRFRHDVDEMVEAVQYIAQYQGGKVPERTFLQEFFRELFKRDRQMLDVGTREVSETTDGYTTELGMTWNVDVDVVVSSPTGPVDFYIQKILEQEMTPGELPEGYTVEAVGEAWTQIASDWNSCAVYRQFILTQNGVSARVVPWIVLEVNEDTGAVVVSEAADGGDLPSGASLLEVPETIPAEAVGKDTRNEMVHVLRSYLAGDTSGYQYIPHDELWAMEPDRLTWEQKALRVLSLDQYKSTGLVPSGYLYKGKTAYTLEEWQGDRLALTEYELLPSEDEDGSLYRMDHVLAVQRMQEWEREIYGYYE